MRALVTGAGRGLGLEVADQLERRGYEVIRTTRDGDPRIDVADGGVSARELAARTERLDVLVNNAAINFDTHFTASTVEIDYLRETLETNLIGAWATALAFLPLLRESPRGRIVNVSSGAGSFTDMTAATPSYSVSKAALNAFTLMLADDLRGTNVKVNAICPGWVRSDMGGPGATRSLAEGAEGIVWAATLPDDGPTGGFFRDGRRIDW